MSTWLAVALVAIGLGIESPEGPWKASDVVEPVALGREVTSEHPPTVISVAFPVLYRNRHILHAVDAGAGSSAEGVAELKRLVAGMPKDADIVIYCGCCPMTKCPNVRPAFRVLQELGYRRVRVLDIPTNMHADWYEKNLPSEKGR